MSLCSHKDQLRRERRKQQIRTRNKRSANKTGQCQPHGISGTCDSVRVDLNNGGWIARLMSLHRTTHITGIEQFDKRCGNVGHSCKRLFLHSHSYDASTQHPSSRSSLDYSLSMTRCIYAFRNVFINPIKKLKGKNPFFPPPPLPRSHVTTAVPLATAVVVSVGQEPAEHVRKQSLAPYGCAVFSVPPSLFPLFL